MNCSWLVTVLFKMTKDFG